MQLSHTNQKKPTQTAEQQIYSPMIVRDFKCCRGLSQACRRHSTPSLMYLYLTDSDSREVRLLSAFSDRVVSG